MTRWLVAAVCVVGLAALALAARGGASARGDAGVILRVGDTMQVEGARIGCQVSERSGRPAIECRRTGKVAGTYTAIFDERRARIARFRSSDTAKIVFTAKHGGGARACGDPAREAGRSSGRAAARGAGRSSGRAAARARGRACR